MKEENMSCSREIVCKRLQGELGSAVLIAVSYGGSVGLV